MYKLLFLKSINLFKSCFKIKIFILLTELILGSNTTNCQDSPLNKEDEYKVYDSIKSVLDNYMLFGSFTVTTNDIYLPYISKFRNLFEGNAYVVNPWSSDNSTSNIEDYIVFCKNNFPSGMSIHLDAIKIDSIYITSNNNLKAEISVIKEIKGINKDKKLLEKKLDLIFKFSFHSSDKDDFYGFKISEIKFRINLPPPPPLIHQTQLSFFVSTMLAEIHSQANNYYANSELHHKIPVSFNIGLKRNFLLNKSKSKKFISCFYIGFDYSLYRVVWAIGQINQLINNTTDLYGGKIDLIMIQDDLNYSYNLNYLGIPLGLSFETSIKQKSPFAVFLELGVKPAFQLNSSYNVDGFFTYKGDYPNAGVVENIPEYGYYSQIYLNEVHKMDIRNYNFFSEILMGMDYSFTNSCGLFIAFGYKYGLLSLTKNSNNELIISPKIDEINNLMNKYEKNKLSAFHLNFGLRFKLNYNKKI